MREQALSACEKNNQSVQTAKAIINTVNKLLTILNTPAFSNLPPRDIMRRDRCKMDLEGRKGYLKDFIK